ncbi:uncharacterized protein LOC116164078 [Photinus pyralis]|uniref:uncharacterized protein LOC116164078 n=1 Tax=Photinus pyralis TaxID=7054 RepID=UPI0012672C4F|nr:uncharacterized protein LOC116164078 [Photinus pyralis]
MHLKCLQHGLVVRRSTVRLLLKELDPEGVSLRSRRRLKRRQYFNKGPNYLWHIDGYDKLKPYGIAINGCIDGYSRHIIWLKACYTNNNPRIISAFFVSSIETCGGCPRSIPTDMGTENSHIAHMQTFLRSRFFINQNSLPAFIYGTSQHNQRIESFWSILRRENAQYWMNLFESLKDENYFNGTLVDKSLIQFCFLHLIQMELDEVCLVWNSHRITTNRGSRTSGGKPIIRYNLPELFGTKDYSVKISEEELDLFKEQAMFLEERTCCDENGYKLCKILMIENNYENPQTVDEALTLYKYIRSKTYELLE